MSTVADWLDSRSAEVPPRLAAAVRDALGPELAAEARLAPEHCLAAAERIVAALLQREDAGRDTALALLAADALVTYAFEAAAEEPESLVARAEAAMQTLATLG